MISKINVEDKGLYYWENKFYYNLLNLCFIKIGAVILSSYLFIVYLC